MADPNNPNGPYIQRDGETNPETKGEETDNTRLVDMTEVVNNLGLYYYFSGDERFAARATELIRVWFLNPETRMNPNMRYAQGIPGVTDGRNYGIIQTRSFLEVIDTMAFLAAYDGWTEADQTGMEQWFADFVEWLITDPLGIEEGAQENNHGTWYDVQVAGFAAFAGRRDVAQRIAQEAPAKRLAVQIDADGLQPHEVIRTKSFFYHAFNLHALYELARVAEHVGVNLWDNATAQGKDLQKALDFVAPYADASAQWPYQEISERKPEDLLPMLLEGALVYQDNRYLEFVGQLPNGTVASSRERLVYPFSQVP